MLDNGFQVADAMAPNPAAVASSREAVDELAATLRLLPPAVRVAIVLRHVDGLSVAETAEALGRPEGTIKAQVSRGLERLRVLLAEPEPANEPAAAGVAARPPIRPQRQFASAEVLR
jgi:DNA-directed RNA polymerase specialized sigma24 family protein